MVPYENFKRMLEQAKEQNYNKMPNNTKHPNKSERWKEMRLQQNCTVRKSRSKLNMNEKLFTNVQIYFFKIFVKITFKAI